MLKALLLILNIFYSIRFVTRLLLPFLFRTMLKRASKNMRSNESKKREGEVSIKNSSKQKKQSNSSVGEYVDYEEKFYHVEDTNLKKTVLEKINEKTNSIIISDHKVSLNKFNKIELNTRYLLPNATHLANSFFDGYGLNNLEII